MAGNACEPKFHELPENDRLNMPAYMSYQITWSSVAFAIVAEMPIEFCVPPGPPTRLITGDRQCCETSRTAVNRESAGFPPSSWFPTVSTSPPMLHTREGELGGPQRSL